MISKRVYSAAMFLALPAAALAQDAAASGGADPVKLVLRWLHIMGAIGLMGAGMFMRAVLMPSAATLPAEAHDQLRAAVRSRWSKVLMVFITILLVTGFANYIMYGMAAHKGQGPYHMYMGIKIMLAIGVFGLGSLLAGRTSLAQKLQANAGLWLSVNLLLGAIIVAIGSYLRYMPTVN